MTPPAGSHDQDATLDSVKPGAPGSHLNQCGWLLFIALAFGATHVVLTWGSIGRFWLDSGRWLHEVDRFARGEVLYRDFVWPFPPMAMWIVGGIARLFGSDLGTIWTTTSLIALLIMVLFGLYVQELVERPVRWLALLAGMLLATTHATMVSAPLPTGMYTPAAPIGFLFLLGALLLCLKVARHPQRESVRRLCSVGIGLLCGLAVLTKQDFWAPAFLLGAWAGRHPTARPRPGLLVELSSVWAPFLVTVATGASFVGLTAGWDRLPHIVHGFGMVAEYAGRQYPSWERITIQSAGAAFVGLVGLVALVRGRSLSFHEAKKWLWVSGIGFAGGSLLHVWMSFQIASDASAGLDVPPSDTLAFMRSYSASTLRLLRGALVWWDFRLENNLFPPFLPAALLACLLACRRRIRDQQSWRLVFVLCLVCLAARLRRGFEHVEWFHLLMEIPLFLSSASLILREGGRKPEAALRTAAVVLLIMGFYLDVRLVLRGREDRCVDTPRGEVCLRPEEAQLYLLLKQALDRLDPGRDRSLLAFGYTGGFNYFLDRSNPTPHGQGFQFAGVPPERLLEQVRSHSPAAVLLDTDHYDKIYMPAPWLNLAHWELATILNVDMRVDRPRFEKALEDCHVFDRVQVEKEPRFVIYDCDPAPGHAPR